MMLEIFLSRERERGRYFLDRYGKSGERDYKKERREGEGGGHEIAGVKITFKVRSRTRNTKQEKGGKINGNGYGDYLNGRT